MDAITFGYLLLGVMSVTHKAFDLIADIRYNDSRLDQLYYKMRAQRRALENWAVQMRVAAGNELNISVSPSDMKEVIEISRKLKEYLKMSENMYTSFHPTYQKSRLAKLRAKTLFALNGYERLNGMVETLKMLNDTLRDIAPPPPAYLQAETRIRRAVFSQLSANDGIFSQMLFEEPSAVVGNSKGVVSNNVKHTKKVPRTATPPLPLEISKCLKLLQDAMVSVNYGGEKEFFLSLRLREDHNQSRIEMQNVRGAAGLSVSRDADVFFFRRHFSELLDDDAHTFIVECRPEKNQNLIYTQSDLSYLDRFDKPPAAEQIQVFRNIERWGSLAKNDSRARFTNIVYYQSNTVQKSDLTLIDMISNPDFLEKMRPEHTARLARLIFYSHLYLQEVVQAQDQPKPRSYVYYHTKKELWDPTQPLILSPWLSIGFGSRRDDDDLGEGPGILPSRNFRIAELGLMLWQLGTGQLLDYDRDIGTLIDQAMSDARLLSQRMGLLYTELTQTCLRHVGPPQHLASPEEMAEENMIIKNCISTLAALDSAMSGTVSKSILQSKGEVVENAPVPAKAQPKDQQSLQETTLSNQQHLDEHYLEGIGSVHMIAPSIKVTVPSSSNGVVPQQISAPLLDQMTANGTRASTNITRSAPSVEASEISLSDAGLFTDIPTTPMTDLENSSLKQANLDRLSNLAAPKTGIVVTKRDLRIVGEDEREAEVGEAEPSYRTPMAC